jgi:mRNA interferase RelE/StbE
MKYGVFIIRRAQKELADLPRDRFEKVTSEIYSLSTEPRPAGCRKLTGRDGWRIRVGDLRVLYDIDDNNKTITIQHVGHRRDVYR